MTCRDTVSSLIKTGDERKASIYAILLVPEIFCMLVRDPIEVYRVKGVVCVTLTGMYQRVELQEFLIIFNLL